MTTVENKIPDVSSLVQKKQIIMQKLVKLKKKLTDRNHAKYITTPEFNTFTKEIFDATAKQADLVTMTDFDTKLMIDTKSLNQKIEKAESSLNQFYRESHFEEDVTQNYLVFQPMDNYFKRISNTDYVLE